jgi:uncharacterized lipoprotein YbaY
MHSVTGAVQFEKDVKPPDNATVYVRLLDTTQSDAAAELVNEQVLQGIDWSQVSEHGIEFHVSTPHLLPNHRYEISVLVDCDGDRQISPGDFYTTQSYPVLTQGYPRHINIQVRQIH